MSQVKCPDCGEMYSEDMQSCPNCGCPNDNWKPKQEEQAQESTVSNQVDYEEDFNENGQYSPVSPSSWLFTDPWPLKNYPRKAFEKEHPFLGWLLGPWHLTCKNEGEKEEYAVINNIFYLFNLIFKTNIYAFLWAFFKGIIVFLMSVLLIPIIGAVMANNNSTGGLMMFGGFTVILFYGMLIFFIVLECCGMGKALHRYWPSIHRTWRRINKRYWDAMKK